MIDNNNNFCGFANGMSMPPTKHIMQDYPNGHPPMVGKLLQKNLQFAPEIFQARANIKQQVSFGVHCLDAVENTIFKISHKIVGKVGKNRFYNTAYNFASRNHAEPKFIEEKHIQSFNDVRSAMTNPHNDHLKYALRSDTDTPELILKDDQVDELFVILQTPSQRIIMSESTVLNVDQNDQVTPAGGCRTLTVSSCYRGNFLH